MHPIGHVDHGLGSKLCFRTGPDKGKQKSLFFEEQRFQQKLSFYRNGFNNEIF